MYGLNPKFEVLHQEKEAKMNTIVQKYNTFFRQILPRRQSILAQDKAFPLLDNHLCVEIIHQFEITLQLLVQQILFCKDPILVNEAYKLFCSFVKKKDKLVRQRNLPKFKIYLNDFKYGNKELFSLNLNQDEDKDESNKANLSFNFNPQISILQSPILEIKDVLTSFLKSGNSNDDEAMDFLKGLSPLVNRYWLPSFQKPNLNTRTKFSTVHDKLLLLGLQKFGSKKLDQVRDYFLPFKTQGEIKNRFKNLIRKKAATNALKTWKILEYAPLTELEKINFRKALLWFGDESWARISKYFLPNRNSKNDRKLLNRREKSGNSSEYENIDALVIDLSCDLYLDQRKYPKFHEQKNLKKEISSPVFPRQDDIVRKRLKIEDSYIVNSPFFQRQKDEERTNIFKEKNQQKYIINRIHDDLKKEEVDGNFFLSEDENDEMVLIDIGEDEGAEFDSDEGEAVFINGKKFKLYDGLYYEVIDDIDESSH